jgi:hypothetical protein
VANAAVVAFHDSCGLARATEEVMIEHNGERRAAVEHVLSRADWPRTGERLDKLARRFAGIRARRATPTNAS